jgi:hypothetical protein
MMRSPVCRDDRIGGSLGDEMRFANATSDRLRPPGKRSMRISCANAPARLRSDSVSGQADQFNYAFLEERRRASRSEAEFRVARPVISDLLSCGGSMVRTPAPT